MALDYYEAIPYRDTLWVLTPQRLHVAQRLQPPEPVDEFPDGPPDSRPKSWLDTNPKATEQPVQSQRKQRLYPLKPCADIPRAHIARFFRGQ
ncbi:hypothetical protein [Kibdelosporangium philippinense]|uniref:hypothetical protein n=1 Tax=Kibdelosporangium philippinense TaxID=211113 RepID=UPI003621A9A1